MMQTVLASAVCAWSSGQIDKDRKDERVPPIVVEVVAGSEH